jgi:beta-glucosidase
VRQARAGHGKGRNDERCSGGNNQRWAGRGSRRRTAVSGGVPLGCGDVGVPGRGAWDEDGKGESIWDRFAHTPGKIKNNDSGDVANDHYHRYAEDVALMKSIGATAYRFSVSWPRIFPDGAGQPNPKGLGFYSRLVDELLAAGIEPFATLYHWDLPLALQDRSGGWESMETVQAVADYAGYVAGQLGDRVKHFFTINEFRSFVEAGYRGLRSRSAAGRPSAWGRPPSCISPRPG